MPHPIHCPWFDYSNNNSWRVQIIKLFLTEFSSSSYFPFWGPNILLITLFSNTFKVCSSLRVRDQASYLYKKTRYSLNKKFVYWNEISYYNICSKSNIITYWFEIKLKNGIHVRWHLCKQSPETPVLATVGNDHSPHGQWSEDINPRSSAFL